MKKTILSLLLSLGMCFGVFVAPVHAQSIGSNQTITGQVNGSSPITYTYTMPKSGYFYYTLSIQGSTYIYRNNDKDEVRNLDDGVYIHNSMKVNYKTYVDEAGAHFNEPYTSDYYSFAKGTKINISFYDGANLFYGFALTIHYINPKNFERESNDTRGKANKIKLNRTINGFVSNDNNDWFVYTASKKGKYKVNCVVTKEHSSSIATQVYKGYKSLNSKDISEGDGWINILNGWYDKGTTVKLNKGQKLYVRLYRSDSQAAWYKLNVKKA